eukprot:gene7271-9910_t
MKSSAVQSTKKRKIHSVNQLTDYMEDVFNTNIVVNSTDLCGMCKQDGLFGKQMSAYCQRVENNNLDGEQDDEEKNVDHESLLDVDMIWASKYSLLLKNTNRRLFVHYFCALYSPRIWFTGEKWNNLRKEVTRGQSLSCKFCGKSGATIGCIETRCSVVSHLPCAIKEGFNFVKNTTSWFTCPDHRQAKLRQASLLDAEHFSDISNGMEPIPVLADRSVFYPNKGFSYSNRNFGSDDVIISNRSVSSMDCCDCTGLCDDMYKCSCLRNGKSYGYNGELIETENPIFECNLGCSCNVRRCTNRVVENGLQYRFKVCDVGNTSNRNTMWGVKTLDKIPENSFVCEITGQYVTQESFVPIIDQVHNKKQEDRTTIGNCRNDTLSLLQRKWKGDYSKYLNDNIIRLGDWESSNKLSTHSSTTARYNNNTSNSSILMVDANDGSDNQMIKMMFDGELC